VFNEQNLKGIAAEKRDYDNAINTAGCAQQIGTSSYRQPSAREQAEKNIAHHAEQHAKNIEAVNFFAENPAFDQFIQLIRKGVIQIGVLLLCAAVTISQIGCTSQQTIAELTATLGNAAASLASIENNPTLAAKLKADTATAVTQIQNWKSGTPTAEVIEALNLVEDDLNLIPGTSQYTPLVDLAIGTVESIISLLPQAPASATASAINARVSRRVVVKTGIKDKKAFIKAWNAQGIPGQPFL
jgi:hypothetical protein